MPIGRAIFGVTWLLLRCWNYCREGFMGSDTEASHLGEHGVLGERKCLKFTNKMAFKMFGRIRVWMSSDGNTTNKFKSQRLTQLWKCKNSTSVSAEKIRMKNRDEKWIENCFFIGLKLIYLCNWTQLKTLHCNAIVFFFGFICFQWLASYPAFN